MQSKLLLTIVAALAISCVGKPNKKSVLQIELDSKIGEKLTLPLTTDTGNFSKFKIVTFVNGDCPPCVAELELWEDFLLKLPDNNSVSFLVYLYSSNVSYLEETCRLLTNPLAVIYLDEEKLFYKKNNLSEVKMLQTFIVDKDNKILLMGNPTSNEKLEDLYLKLLNNEIQISK